MERGSALDDGAEAQLGVKERVLLDDVEAGRRLGGLALEELEASGRVGEEVTHFHDGSRRGTRRALLEDATRPEVDATAGGRAFDVGNRGDAGQRFAPEAEGPDRFQVGQRRTGLARRAWRWKASASWSAGIPVPSST